MHVTRDNRAGGKMVGNEGEIAPDTEDVPALEDGDAPTPTVPAFFAVSDLPDWLRAPLPSALPTAPVSSVIRHESARARQAWATNDAIATPDETGEFQTAGATALTRLVPTAPVPSRKRRGLFGLGATLPLSAFVA